MKHKDPQPPTFPVILQPFLWVFPFIHTSPAKKSGICYILDGMHGMLIYCRYSLKFTFLLSYNHPHVYQTCMTFFCENKGILKNVPVVVLDPIDVHCILHGCSMMVHKVGKHQKPALTTMNLDFSEGNTVPQRERQFDKKQFKDPSGLTEKRKRK